MSSGTDSPRMRHGGRIAAILASTLACAFALVSPGPSRGATVTDSVEAGLTAATGAQVPVVVRFKDQVDERAYEGRPEALIRALRATARRSQTSATVRLDGPARSFWLVNAIATRASAAELAALAADPAVASIDVDPTVTVAGATSAASTVDGSWGIHAIGADTVWTRYGVTGAGVRVGSIDTGVDASSPELAGAIAAWHDFVNGRPAPYDDNGHGTHTVGTMVARNVGGRFGVAPGAQAVVAKAIRADGSASGSDLLAAAQWMTDPDGDPATADFPAVINNSWTAPDATNEWFRPMVQTWAAMGIVPVFGAGNSGDSIGNPASYPESLTVGSLDESGAVAPASSRGLVTWNIGGVDTVISKPDLAAPGVFITSTVPGGYGVYSGSSMAAPHVAGTVALLKQARPDLDPAAIRALLAATAADRGAPGPDLESGAGSVNALAAVAATGAPVVATVPAQAVALPQRPTRVRVLRIARRGGMLIIRGRVTGPARMRVAMRRTARSTNSLTGPGTKAVAVRRGTFVLRVRARGLHRGRYVLVVTASDAAGRRLASTSRAVKIR